MTKAKDLSRLLRPRSIAVLGGGWAANAVRACEAMGYDGEVWPVHPSKPEVAGRKAYPNLSALPAAPDAAFVAVNRDASIGVMEELADMGVVRVSSGAGLARIALGAFVAAAEDMKDGGSFGCFDRAQGMSDFEDFMKARP